MAAALLAATGTTLSSPDPIRDHRPARDWTQTRLEATPALREQIDRTQAFLRDRETALEQDLVRWRATGRLDRRAAMDIRRALQAAGDTLDRLTAGEDWTARQIDGRTTRLFAYELGMAADTLRQQASSIPPEAVSPDRASSPPASGQPPLTDWLRQAGDLLYQSAQALVYHLH